MGIDCLVLESAPAPWIHAPEMKLRFDNSSGVSPRKTTDAGNMKPVLALKVPPLLNEIELEILRHAKQHDANTFHLLDSVPGVGKILAPGLSI